MRAIEVKPASSWSGDAVDSVILGYDDRHRRRMAMTGARGLSFLLDLSEAAFLRHGDALVLEDGRLIEVLAAPEPLLEIRCGDPLQLARVAWHFGNRHLPTQLFPKYLRVRRDHVIADLAVRLGAHVIEIEGPFDPEGGAYETPAHAHGGDDHRHDHADRHHGHGHSHSHSHSHNHGR